MAFWFPNFSRATVGESSATGVELMNKVISFSLETITVRVHLGREEAAATAAAAPAPGIAPNPSRGKAADLGVAALGFDPLPLVVDGVRVAFNPISFAFLNASASFLAFSSSSSAVYHIPTV